MDGIWEEGGEREKGEGREFVRQAFDISISVPGIFKILMQNVITKFFLNRPPDREIEQTSSMISLTQGGLSIRGYLVLLGTTDPGRYRLYGTCTVLIAHYQ